MLPDLAVGLKRFERLGGIEQVMCVEPMYAAEDAILIFLDDGSHLGLGACPIQDAESFLPKMLRLSHVLGAGVIACSRPRLGDVMQAGNGSEAQPEVMVEQVIEIFRKISNLLKDLTAHKDSRLANDEES